MRRSLFVLCLLGCGGASDVGIPDSGTEGDADADADSDADADADADTDSDADADTARMRVLHVAPGLPPQDLLANGNPGAQPLVGLVWLQAFPDDAPGWVSRPADLFTVELFDSGSPTPWTTFQAEFAESLFYGLVVVGQRSDDTGAAMLPEPRVLVMEEPRATVPVGSVRLRWTHATPRLADRPYALRDAVSGVTFATLSFGEWADTDLLPTELHPYVDLDEDGACSDGEAFQAFTRAPDEYFHVLLTSEEDGTLLMVGHAENAEVPVRTVVPCPP